jgi:propanediol dehydratase small subunit
VPATLTQEAVKDAEALFAKLRTANAGPTPGASNASLDPRSLSSVLSTFLSDRKLKITTENTAVSQDGTKVTYILQPAAATSGRLTDYYIVKIQPFSATAKATAAMKDFIAEFERPGFVKTLDPKRASLGDYALRSWKSVLWVCGESVFVQVSHEVDTPRTASKTQGRNFTIQLYVPSFKCS